jgi:major vault protein
LSGGKPKVENAIKSFSLALGPDFMTDLVTVETSDHAILDIQLAYDWHFIYNKEDSNNKENLKLFSIRDFVGNACKSISSRIRGAVSAKTYDEFHHCSAKIIKDAVFGVDKKSGETRKKLFFDNNSLMITSCDIKSIRPVDADIEQKLKQNTFLSIKIKAEATELAFTSQQEMLEQQKKGELDIQEIEDNTEAEKLRKEYYTAVAELNSIASLGVSISRAKAETEKARIEGENNVAVSKIESDTLAILNNQEAEELRLEQKLKYDYESKESNVNSGEQQSLSKIEVEKIEKLMKAIGPKTLASIINAEPKMQQDLLKSLGLQGYLMTDGRNPINLFDTAQGLVHQQAMGKM